MLTGRSLTSTLDRMMSLERAFDQALDGTMSAVSRGQRWVPAIDVVERKDAYVVMADVPGAERDRIAVKFEQNVLTIAGTKAPTPAIGEGEEVRIYAAERVSGAFERTVRFPEFVDAEKIDAKLEHGVLTITIPKAVAAQPRSITIG